MKVINHTAGPRGVNLMDGTTFWVEPGASAEFDKDKVQGDLPDFGNPSDPTDDPNADRVAQLEAELKTAQERIAELEAGGIGDVDITKPATSKGTLLRIAEAEGVEVADDATKAQIIEAIQAKRG